MKALRSAFVLAFLVLVAVPAFADVTVKVTVSTTGGQVAMEISSVTYVKGMKMRSDVKVMDQDMSMFVDVAAKQQVMINNTTKQVMDFNALMANLPMTFGDITVSVKPSGQTKEVLGLTCAGFTIEVTMPMTMMNETITMTMSGSAWIAKEGPGIAEYQAFTKASLAAGLMANPLAQGPQAKGLAQMQAALGDNGIPLEQDLQITVTGGGEMAQAMSQMGNMRMTMKVTSISTDPIADDLLAMPAAAAKK